MYVNALQGHRWYEDAMKPNDYSDDPLRGAGGQRSELINRACLGIVADAWNRYPSEIPLPRVDTDDQQLLGQVLGLLAEEMVLHVTDTSVALTDSGYAAVEQAGRANHQLSEVSQGGSPAEGSGSCSLMLAILRANFERRSQSNG